MPWGVSLNAIVQNVNVKSMADYRNTLKSKTHSVFDGPQQQLHCCEGQYTNDDTISLSEPSILITSSRRKAKAG